MSEEPRLVVRPRGSIITTAWASLALAAIPVFGVLYWFGAVYDALMFVVVLNVLVLLIALAMWMRQLQLLTVVTDTELYGQGAFSPMVRVPLDRIAAIHLVETYTGQSSETSTQFLAVDAEGRRLFRMRGEFWPPGTMEQVANAIPARVVRSPEPVSMSEFFATYPTAAYWFENRPWLMIGLVIVGSVASIAVAIGVAHLLDIPVAGV